MVNVVIIAVSLGRPEAQADWLRPNVCDCQALVLHSSNKPSELSQWQCHDDGTTDIVVVITIAIFAQVTKVKGCFTSEHQHIRFVHEAAILCHLAQSAYKHDMQKTN